MKTIKILILSILVLSINLFASSVATITALKGSATIHRDGASLQASIGSKLEQKDVIKTKENSKLQIIFKDETIITLGKNSNFSIAEFIFEENQKPVAKFGMIKGAMRTITGKIGKIAPEKFSVQTKTATIGIRGTNFAIVIGDDGSHQAYCTYGAISVTINNEPHVVKQGLFISVSPGGKAEIKEFTPQDLKEMKKKNYGEGKLKIAQVSEGSSVEAGTDEENSEQLDVTVTEDSSIVIQDVTDTNTDATQQPFVSVENYVMNNAHYTGTYKNDTGTTPLGINGIAVLDVDFGADALSLTLTDSDGDFVKFNRIPKFTDKKFTVGQEFDAAGPGKADGEFLDPTGNTVNGTFIYNDNPGSVGNLDNGHFKLSTSQTLF